MVLKLILETSQLTEAEIVAGCVLAASASFDFVKTSTGFNGRGASLDDVYLMHAAASELADVLRSEMAYLRSKTAEAESEVAAHSLRERDALLRSVRAPTVVIDAVAVVVGGGGR